MALVDIEKPYTLVQVSLGLRKQLQREGHPLPLRDIVNGFISYYQDGHPPRITQWLPEFVKRDLLLTLQEPPTSIPPQLPQGTT